MSLDNQKELYKLLKDSFINKKELDKEYISEKTNLSISSINKYIKSKLLGLYLDKIDNKYYKVINFIDVCETDFLNCLSQSNNKIEYTENEYKYKKLKERSYEQFCLAIEIYNKPLLNNKIEVFSILLANAWELILKSKYLKTNKNIYGKKHTDYTKPLIHIVQEEFRDNLSIKQNLEYLIKIRDKSTHFLIDIEIYRAKFSRIFQSSVINYINFYEDHFGDLSILKENKGMLSIVIDSKDEQVIIKNKYLENEIIDLNNFIKEIELLESNHKYDSNFIVSIDYSLKFDDKKKTEILLTQSPSSQEAIIIEKTKNLEYIYPYSYSNVKEKIKEYLIINNKNIKFNNYILNKINKDYNLKEKEKYCSKNSKSFNYTKTKYEFYSEEYLNYIKKILAEPNK